MLDVDGHVISPDVLIQRIQDLLATTAIAEATQSGDATDVTRSTGAAEPSLVTPIHAMRVAHRELHPPALGSGGGLRGRVGRSVKRLVRKLTSWYVEPRWTLQQELDARSIEFASLAYNSMYHRETLVDLELEDLRSQNARLKLQLVDASERLSRYRNELGDYHRELLELRDELTETGDIASIQLKKLLLELAQQPERGDAFAEELAYDFRGVGPKTSRTSIDSIEFQRRFRGSDEEIQRSQAPYVAYFPSSSEPGVIVDIGCGRGEMMELLKKDGHEVFGIDTDPRMVKCCESRGLAALVDDGNHYLAGLAEGELKGIFCAQVVEHMTTRRLEQFIQLSLRALRPSGVLVIETINPRSSFALGNHFYADTTHVRPVHPETLRFLCEQFGFTTVRLTERSPHPSLGLASELPEDSVGEAVGTLLKSVFGYQDYVIVATK
jgi:2-polyprenyl-3-methyl-5-hydroxy-6-metoxy-1,4-benzoquinol methylase